MNAVIRPTVARVDLTAIADNYRQLRQVVGRQVGVIAVVKADAYGHGARPVARLLEGLGAALDLQRSTYEGTSDGVRVSLRLHALPEVPRCAPCVARGAVRCQRCGIASRC